MQKQSSFLSEGQIFEHAEVGDSSVYRDGDGIWRYVNGRIAVPGARDVTLTDRFDPKFVISVDGDIERVIISGPAIASDPDLLGWCLEKGTIVGDGDNVEEVLVPYDVWLEHDRVPGELFSPEHEGTEVERQVAAAEREFREAEKRLERAADNRAEMLRRAAGEMTRQEARTITGLSVGRIQQLIRADRVDTQEMAILEQFDGGAIDTFMEFVRKAHHHELLQIDEGDLQNVVTDLQNRGFLELTDKGVGLTAEGVSMLQTYQQAVARGEV